MKNELEVVIEKSGLDKTKAQVLLDNFAVNVLVNMGNDL